MSYDAETTKGDHDVDTVANPDHDVDTPSGTRYVENNEQLSTGDTVALVVVAVLVLGGCITALWYL